MGTEAEDQPLAARTVKVRHHDGQEKTVHIDGNPLSMQICRIVRCFDVPFSSGRMQFVLTMGTDDTTRRVRNTADLHQARSLGLVVGLSTLERLVGRRMDRLDSLILAAGELVTTGAAKRSLQSALEGFFRAIHGDQAVAFYAIAQGAHRLIARAIDATMPGDEDIVEVAMTCWCELFEHRWESVEALAKLAKDQSDVAGPRFCRRLVQTLLGIGVEASGKDEADDDGHVWVQEKKGASDSKRVRLPHSTLYALLLVLESCPEFARFVHGGIDGSFIAKDTAANSGSLYPHIVGAIGCDNVLCYEEVTDRALAWRRDASKALLTALLASAAGNPTFHKEVKRAIEAADKHHFTAHPDDEHVLVAKLEDASNLTAVMLTLLKSAANGTGSLLAAQLDNYSHVSMAEKVAKLEKRNETLSEINTALKKKLQAKDKALAVVAPFVKLPPSCRAISDSVESLLSSGWDGLNFKDGYTLLHYIAEYVKETSVADMIFAFAADPEKPDDEGKTPLDYARATGNAVMVDKLEQLYREYDEQNFTVRAEERSKEEVDKLRKRLERMGSVPDKLYERLREVVNDGPSAVGGPRGFSVVHMAAQAGHVLAVRWLVDAGAGAYLAAPDDFGLAPMDYAVQSGHSQTIEVIQDLLHDKIPWKSRCNSEVSVGGPIVTRAATKISLPRHPGSDVTATIDRERMLRKAISNVLQHGWERISWPHDFSALHLAACQGDAPSVLFLLQVRASAALDLKDERGKKPIDYAMERKGAEEVVHLLNGGPTHVDAKDRLNVPDAKNSVRVSAGSFALSIGVKMKQAVCRQITVNSVLKHTTDVDIKARIAAKAAEEPGEEAQTPTPRHVSAAATATAVASTGLAVPQPAGADAAAGGALTQLDDFLGGIGLKGAAATGFGAKGLGKKGPLVPGAADAVGGTCGSTLNVQDGGASEPRASVSRRQAIVGDGDAASILASISASGIAQHYGLDKMGQTEQGMATVKEAPDDAAAVGGSGAKGGGKKGAAKAGEGRQPSIPKRMSADATSPADTGATEGAGEQNARSGEQTAPAPPISGDNIGGASLCVGAGAGAVGTGVAATSLQILVPPELTVASTTLSLDAALKILDNLAVKGQDDTLKNLATLAAGAELPPADVGPWLNNLGISIEMSKALEALVTRMTREAATKVLAELDVILAITKEHTRRRGDGWLNSAKPTAESEAEAKSAGAAAPAGGKAGGKGKKGAPPPPPGAVGVAPVEAPATAPEVPAAPASPAKGNGKKGVPPPPPGAEAAAPIAEAVPATPEEPAASPAGGKKGGKGKAPPPPGGKAAAAPEPPPAPAAAGGKGKAPPPPGGKGAPAPPGPNGKAGAGAPAAGKATPAKATAKIAPSKPKIRPRNKMKNLHWNYYIYGKDMKKGETIWDDVLDYSPWLPIEKLAIFEAGGTKEPKPAATTEAKPVAKGPDFIRVVTGSDVQTAEMGLRNCPPVSECAAALQELDDTKLSVEQLKALAKHGVPDEKQAEMLKGMREAMPDVPLANIEQYMWVLGNIPGIHERLESWIVCREVSESATFLVEKLHDAEYPIDCVIQSQNFPRLLSVFLAVGNYLNGGHLKGQADGFGLGDFKQGYAFRSANGQPLTQLILEVYLDMDPAGLEELIAELQPALFNIKRSAVVQEGAMKVVKTMRAQLEDLSIPIKKLVNSFDKAQNKTMTFIKSIKDDSDTFKILAPKMFEQGAAMVKELTDLVETIEAKFKALCVYMKIPTATKTDQFFIEMLDDFFVPADKLASMDADDMKHIGKPMFLSGRTFTLYDLLVFWKVVPFSEKEASQQERTEDVRPKALKARIALEEGKLVRKGEAITELCPKAKSKLATLRAGDDGVLMVCEDEDTTTGNPATSNADSAEDVDYRHGLRTEGEDAAAASRKGSGKAVGKGSITASSPGEKAVRGWSIARPAEEPKASAGPLPLLM